MLSRSLRNIFKATFATLTKVDAEARSQYIKTKSIDYSYHLTLHKGTTYDGLTNMTFETNSIPSQVSDKITIDFNGKEVNGLLVN